MSLSVAFVAGLLLGFAVGFAAAVYLCWRPR